MASSGANLVDFDRQVSVLFCISLGQLPGQLGQGRGSFSRYWRGKRLLLSCIGQRINGRHKGEGMSAYLSHRKL